MGNVIGFAASFLIYSIFYKGSGLSGAEQQIYLLMLLPSILGYTLIPFGAGIWEKIYFKLYEMGNNAFYISSPGEIAENQSSQDKSFQEETDINIEG